MTKKISVVIPAYQAEKYLPEAVMSVRSQNWNGGFEIIIADDGSDDGTFGLAQKLGDTALTGQRRGAASARNEGIRASSGELILLLDADDVLLPGSVSRMQSLLEQNLEAAAVFGLVQDFISPELTEEQRGGLRMRQGYYGGILPGASLIRKSTFDKIGYFDETLKNGGETVAWMIKLRDSGLPTIDLNEPVLKRRLHLTNTGRVNPQQEMQSYAAILRQRMRKK